MTSAFGEVHSTANEIAGHRLIKIRLGATQIERNGISALDASPLPARTLAGLPVPMALNRAALKGSPDRHIHTLNLA